MDKKGAVVRCPKRQGGVTPPNHNTCSVDIVYCIEKYCIPISEYKPYNHGGKPNPITAINNLYNLKPTVNNNNTEYFREQQYINNSNRLYSTLNNNTSITHEDIVTLYNNPYLSTISNWSNISTQEQNIIRKEYPGTDDLAKAISTAKKDFTAILSNTSPDIRNFVNNFAIPLSITSQHSNNNSLLSKAAKKVVNACHRYNDFTERAWEIGWLHSVYEDDDLMNAEERQAFKQWVINREIREQQNGFIEVLGSVLNVAEVLGVTSSLKVFKPSISLSLRPLSDTKAFKEAIKVIKTAPQKMENFVTQVKQSFFTSLGNDLNNILQPNRQVAGVGNIRTTTTPEINLNTDFYTARGMKYAGKNHEVTGVPFTKDGYPIFDNYAKVEVRITGDLAHMKSTEHQKLATIELRKLINSGKIDKNMFTADELVKINKGVAKISDAYTWHHHQDVGRMQLVPYELHKKSGHNGGNTIWGSGK